MTAYELKNIAILNVKEIDFRCILLGISRSEAVKRLNNSVLDNKGVLEMDFGANKTLVEIIREGAFGGTCYARVNETYFRKSWKEFDQLKDIDQRFYCSDYHDASVNKYNVKCVTLIRFGKIKVGLVK